MGLQSAYSYSAPSKIVVNNVTFYDLFNTMRAIGKEFWDLYVHFQNYVDDKTNEKLQNELSKKNRRSELPSKRSKCTLI